MPLYQMFCIASHFREYVSRILHLVEFASHDYEIETHKRPSDYVCDACDE